MFQCTSILVVSAILISLVVRADENDLVIDGKVLTLENSGRMRDPFRHYIPKVRTAEAKVSEADTVAVEQLKLVGVITGTKKNKALIALPSGKMQIFADGAHIGARHGVIRKITRDAVYVEERVLNVLGEEEKLQAKIEFGPEKFGQQEVGRMGQNNVQGNPQFNQPFFPQNNPAMGQPPVPQFIPKR